MALSVMLALVSLPAVAPGASATSLGNRPGIVMGRPAVASYPAYCAGTSDYLSRADGLMMNRYLLDPHPVVTLAADPTWSEDPLRDANWSFQFHALRYTLDLFQAWNATGSQAYLDRALFLLRDWYRDNPRSDPPSEWSWDDHSTAWRAVIYACAADLTPMTSWLEDALILHGSVLADPAFYVRHGNHALNQSIGLLEVGRVLGRSNWTSLAADRMNALILESVDVAGVTNEQSVDYQAYNYARYTIARDRLMAVGLNPGSGFDRVGLMPRFLAQATVPDGTFEMLGDTEASPLRAIPGTWAEFVASEGVSGPTPPLVKAYSAGYLFLRSGWGSAREFTDETHATVRWGPATVLHGHPDGTSLTLYSWGSRLIVDPGKYTYNPGRWREYFRSRSAHNVVTVDGLSWPNSASTSLVGRTTTAGLVDIRLKTSGYAGVSQQRRITYSRALDYVLLADKISSRNSHTYRQLWHLVDHANLSVGTDQVRTRRSQGNVLIRQLTGLPRLRVVEGARDPVQGWVSYRYGSKVAAPVVEAIQRGSNVRYLTLIVPAAGRPAVQVTGLRLHSDGYAVTITIGGRAERVVARGSNVSITPL